MNEFHLLLVCTANQCRSPMAEHLARKQMDQRGIAATVESAGILTGGVEATGGAVAAMKDHGLDLSGHLSRTVTRDQLDPADLILTMERRHLVSIAELDLDAINRSFTLKEIVELAPLVGPRSRDLAVDIWIERVNAFRPAGTALSFDRSSDVGDPTGGPQRGYRRAADEINSLIASLFSFLFPRD